MSEHWNRDAILRRFEQLLDNALQSEAPPSGIPAELLEGLEPMGSASSANTTDAYELQAAMTQLTQEVKLQGRAFQELSLALGGQTNRLGDEIRATCKENEREAVRIAQRDAERRCRKETLQTLIDLHDRLMPGLDTARDSARREEETRSRESWLRRRLQGNTGSRTAEVLAALVKGYELSLERIAVTMAELHAREVRCMGELFDPKRMNAVDTEETSAVPEGTVLEVYRNGYEWMGELLRPAQVKVARAPKPKEGAAV